ncbi:TPA: hypothetical protein ACG3NY_000116 [Staphylococcus aureus]|nr:hypothetical protein [Staphylococcus aureus]HAR4756650.1 hypothetical protein [Staphylococcus aureus]HDG3437103.1 hypothetical protein [Staphylococcus aureus]HDG3888884.1 hypothetical protein [Staphylococcus aureus]HEG9654127.1 hypothetical protein [Staphylococcus aureus]
MSRRTNNLDNTSFKTKKTRFLYTCNFLKDFKKGFKKIDLCILIILLVIIFCFVCEIIKYKLDSNLDVLKKFVPLLLTYYSITIGFTLSSLTFMAGNIEKYKSKAKKLFKNIITFCISYIVISLITIIVYLSLFLVMHYFNFEGTNYWIKLFTYYISLILPIISIYIFIKITLIIYLFSLNLSMNNEK